MRARTALGILFVGVLMAAVAVVVIGAPARATTISVTTEAEYRNALTTLSADASGPHVIEVAADITIDDGTDPLYNGTQPLTLNGNGFTLDAAGTSRILDHDTTALLTVNAVTMSNGSSSSRGGAIVARGGGSLTIADSAFTGNIGNDGGAVDASDAGAVVTVSNSRFEDNGDPLNAPFTADGGAIRASDVIVTGSTFIGNAGENGGAVYTSTGAQVVNSTFIDNTGTQGGGAIQGEDISVTGSTFADNTTNDGGTGGALEGSSEVTAVNSTFTGNSADRRGGAIAANESMTLVYATVVANTSPLGANLFVGDARLGPGPLTSFGSVVTDPLGAGANCDLGTTTSGGHNYSDDASCGLTGTGDTQNGADPQLLALGDFGGPTQTRPPAVASPLVDAIPVASCDPTVTTDQRGLARPSDGNDDGANGCDIGAVELQATSPPTSAPPPAAGPVAARPSFTG